MDKSNGKLNLVTSMVIFGSIGLFRRNIALPSSVIAVVRGILGAVFLLAVTKAKKQKLDREAIRKNAGILIVSGLFIGINWILLFEAYNYTTVATATLCYYFEPVIVTLLSPLVLSEKLTGKKVICVLIALIGMVFVSGILEAGFSGVQELKGVLFGTGAACFYSGAVLLNKKLKNIGSYETSIIQLFMAGALMIPYVMIAKEGIRGGIDARSFVLLLIVSFVHTGFAYHLYFGGIRKVPAQVSAILSYIDPVVAILLSAVLLKEPMTAATALGAVLILGATLASEVRVKH